MSQENVEIVRELPGRWQRGDLGRSHDLRPEHRVGRGRPHGQLAGTRIYRGLDEIGATYRDWIEAWDLIG